MLDGSRGLDDPDLVAKVEALDTDALLVLAETLARVPEISGPIQEGHLTVMRFTHHWKAVFRTPDFPADRGLVEVWQGFPTAREAVISLVLRVPTQRQLKAALDSIRFSKPRALTPAPEQPSDPE